MGYTHYWKFKNGIAPKDIEGGAEKFKQSVALFKECLAECDGKTKYPNWGEERYQKEVPMKLGNGVGKGEPIITDTEICFNGWAKDGEDYETFAISVNDGEWDFCKTGRMPYDTAVCLALLCFKHYFGGDFDYSSDGGETEWMYAKSIFRKVIA